MRNKRRTTSASITSTDATLIKSTRADKWTQNCSCSALSESKYCDQKTGQCPCFGRYNERGAIVWQGGKRCVSTFYSSSYTNYFLVVLTHKKLTLSPFVYFFCWSVNLGFLAVVWDTNNYDLSCDHFSRHSLMKLRGWWVTLPRKRFIYVFSEGIQKPFDYYSKLYDLHWSHCQCLG